MKILLREQQDELLKCVAACQIICNSYVKNVEAFAKMTENLSYIAVNVGGNSGADKVMNTVRKYNE